MGSWAGFFSPFLLNFLKIFDLFWAGLFKKSHLISFGFVDDSDCEIYEPRELSPIATSKCQQFLIIIKRFLKWCNETTLSILVKACSWIKGIKFDLPRLVFVASHYDEIEHVGGNTFENVSKADVAFLMIYLLSFWLSFCFI